MTSWALARELALARGALLADEAGVVGEQVGVLLLEQLMRVMEPRVLVLERGAADAFGRDVLLVAGQAAVGIRQAVLQDALEAGFGVALLTAAAVLVLEATFTAARAVFEE